MSLLLTLGSPSHARGVLARWGHVAAYLVLGALTLVPLLRAAVPPLIDYPEHLARMWLLLHAKDIPALASNYVVDWRLFPDLAMDLIVPALAHLLPLEDAGRVFIALVMAGLVLGTMALHRALHGHVGLLPLASLLFVYNAALYSGFVNFLFTLGLALLTFAAWVGSARWTPARRAMAFALPASLLWICHLFGFGVYGLLVASYEIGRLRDERRWTLDGLRTTATLLAQFMPAGVLWAATLGKDPPGYTAYGSLVTKLFAAMAPATFGWSPPTALDALVLLLAVNFLIYAKLRGALRIVPAMRWPIFAMLVAAVLMPDWLYGSWAADLRLPIALAFVVVASLRFTDAARGRVAARGFAIAALVLLGLRIWAVSQSWSDADRRYAEFRSAARALPEGARLLVVVAPVTGDAAHIDGVPSLLARRAEMTFWHLPALEVIDRSVFLPYFFTGATPIRFNPRNAALTEPHPNVLAPADLLDSAAPGWRPAHPYWPDGTLEMPYWVDWGAKFDFVVWLDFTASPRPRLENLQPWASGSFFDIYRIVR